MSVSKNQQTKTWTVQIWYKDFTGKRKHTTKRGFATKRDAEKWEREFLASDHPEHITIGALAKKFYEDMELKVISGEIRDTTYIRKKDYIKLYVLPYFDSTIAENVTTFNVNEWLGKLSKKKCMTGSRLSSGTIKMAKQSLSQIFAFGIKNFGLKENPVNDSNNVSFYTNDKRVMWTKEQFILFHNTIQEEQTKLALDIVFGSGLRIGEVLALTPADILPYFISVVKTVARKEREIVIHKPKTPTSKRKVEIPRSLYYRIKEYVETIKDIKPTDRIFSVDRGHIKYMLNKIQDKLGLPHTSPHQLRHLYASLVYSETKDLAIVSKQLGHKNMDITAKVYAHMLDGNDRLAIDQLESVLVVK